MSGKKRHNTLNMSNQDNKKVQLLFFFVLSSIITHSLGGHIKLTSAAGTSSGAQSSTPSETTSSSQPLWSYQVKPNSAGYLNIPNNQQQFNSNLGHHYPSSFPASLFEAFSGLSQRQGALSSSPFLSILPIILIAAGGMLLLLPFLTMMIASPFSGAGAFGGGGFNNGNFGYPPVGGLNKKRSLSGNGEQFGQHNLVDLMENVSTTIEELVKKYTATGNPTSNPLNSNTSNKISK